MAVELVFETHATTVDNERGVATGWLDGELSEEGRRNARALGARRRDDGIACIFTSDLGRAVETTRIAFDDAAIEIREDARLRECNYGRLNGAAVDLIHPKGRFVDHPYPDGESWRECSEKMRSFLDDLAAEFDGRRILAIAHSAQRYALRHLLEGTRLEDVVDAPFEWQEGWEYVVPANLRSR